MPGTIAYTGLSLGVEVTPGTLVPATRALYPSQGFLTIDNMKTRHEGAQRGTRSNITYETTMGQAVTIGFSTEPTRGCSFNDLIYAFINLHVPTPVPASSAITWTFVPVQTTDPVGKTLTIEAYSDTQEVEVGGVRARGFEISAARGSMTQLSCDWFAQTAIAKSTKTTPVHNNDILIPGYLWTPKFASSYAGLTGASVSTNFLREFTLNIDTGYRPHYYLDGSVAPGQGLPSANLAGTISMTVDDTALAFTEMYDKAAAGTVSFVRLKATGPALSAANYDAQIDFPVLWDDPSLWAADVDGANTHTATGVLAYDSTGTNMIKPVLVNSLTALTA